MDRLERTEGSNSTTLYSWYVAVVLMLVYAISFVDRKLPFILAESIKHDLHLSDTMLGLLTGFAFSLVYALTGLPVAKIADRSSRKWIIVAAISIWSVLTALGGIAQNFLQLAATRTGVAIGEASCTPAAHSMLADRFPHERRASALAVYAVGSPLGILLGLWLGGLIAELSSWRIAMMLLGIPGLTLAVVVAATVREPTREKPAQAVPAGTIGEALRLFLRTPALRHMFIAGALVTTASSAANAFGPAYVIRTFGLSVADTGLLMGLVAGGGGLVGALAGGYWGDLLRSRNPRHALWLVGICLAVGGPFLVAAFAVKQLWLFVLLLIVPTVTAMVYAGPCFATVQSLVPANMRSLATAVYLLALSGIGTTLGPFLAGILSDAFRAATGSEGLGAALMIVAVGKIWGGAHYVIAGMKLRDPAAET